MEGKEKIVACYKEVFNSGPGKVVLADFNAAFGKRTSYVPGDPYGTAFKEGARSVLLRIQHMLENKLEEIDNG